MNRKIAIFGCGNTGSSAAAYLAEQNLADLAIVDVQPGLARGTAMDLMQAAPLRQYHIHITGSEDPAIAAGADVVVVTAGRVRKPGMVREELLDDNATVIASLAGPVRELAPDATVIVVTEPVDAMTCLMLRLTGFPPERVMGLTGILDITRLRYFIAERLGISARDVSALVIGGHHRFMVPVSHYTRVGGVTLDALLPPETITELGDRMRQTGAEIVEQLQEGSAHYTPGACIAQLAASILLDRKRAMGVTTLLRGDFGLADVCLGVLAVVGRGGVERILPLRLNEEDAALFRHCAEHVRASQQALLAGRARAGDGPATKREEGRS